MELTSRVTASTGTPSPPANLQASRGATGRWRRLRVYVCVRACMCVRACACVRVCMRECVCVHACSCRHARVRDGPVRAYLKMEDHQEWEFTGGMREREGEGEG